MANGQETRAAIDTETVRGLLLINGGGAVALLAFLPGVLQKPELADLAKAIMWSVFAFQLGLVFALVHNRFRRLCSLEYAKKPESRKMCRYFHRHLQRPCICHWSVGIMWASTGAFLFAGLIVLKAGLKTVDSPSAKPHVTRQEGIANRESRSAFTKIVSLRSN